MRARASFSANNLALSAERCVGHSDRYDAFKLDGHVDSFHIFSSKPGCKDWPLATVPNMKDDGNARLNSAIGPR